MATTKATTPTRLRFLGVTLASLGIVAALGADSPIIKQGHIDVPAHQNNGSAQAGPIFLPDTPNSPGGTLVNGPVIIPSDNRPFTARLGFGLARGQFITLTPDPNGHWVIDPGRPAYSLHGNGNAAPPGKYPLPNAPQGCLLVRPNIDTENWQVLDHPMTLGGPFPDLLFIPNDDKRDDNSGQIRVDFVVR